MKRGLTVAAALAAVTVAGVGAAAAADTAAAPERAHTYDVTFAKHLTDPATFSFAGVSGGAAAGQLRSQFLQMTAPETPQYEFVQFRWTVDAGPHSFVALTSGTLDRVTGDVDMTGTVDTGWHAGAEVLEKGQLTDPTTVSYSGDLVLLVRPGDNEQ
jgi:hypothetical protein